MRIALYQPDIPQNAGAILRLGACLGLPVDIIEPCGFVWSESRMRRAGIDYLDHVTVVRHAGWQAFTASVEGRLILSTTKAAQPYTNFEFQESDTLLFGQESVGVPDFVHDSVDARILIPMRTGMRSINLAMSAALITGEAFRQVDGFAQLVLDGSTSLNSSL